MDRDKILTMDPYILLSWTNMKLRDYYGSLDVLCEEFDLGHDDILSRLKAIGYSYNKRTNQFVSF
jgi:hypothetical protein